MPILGTIMGSVQIWCANQAAGVLTHIERGVPFCCFDMMIADDPRSCLICLAGWKHQLADLWWTASGDLRGFVPLIVFEDISPYDDFMCRT